MLIGNKADLIDDRDVSSEYATEFAEENGIPYFEISAKTEDNVKSAMDSFIDRVYLHRYPMAFVHDSS